MPADEGLQGLQEELESSSQFKSKDEEIQINNTFNFQETMRVF